MDKIKTAKTLDKLVINNKIKEYLDTVDVYDKLVDNNAPISNDNFFELLVLENQMLKSEVSMLTSKLSQLETINRQHAEALNGVMQYILHRDNELYKDNAYASSSNDYDKYTTLSDKYDNIKYKRIY